MGKVMFSLASVILLTAGCGVEGLRCKGGGVGGMWCRGVCAADGTHPTGMHTCYFLKVSSLLRS